ncbi:transcriptional regulator GutM [Salinivibrio sp. ES.052]|uniref:transcriptional regulator GutM n=1 Tax=Salinivibrio sp. ES.052 TaxID=1882823 RepID=UPI000929FBC0|nr:transcriptional regulator GutM [Salinivibrio sp. ES.052]SIN86985.1 glucitol operon activator protein [Salinivibrio sp. ES.052]
MDTTWSIIYVAILAWGLQIVFGYFQVRAFNKILKELSQKGSVRIGRTKSRWKPRTVVIIAANENEEIVDFAYMKGVSIFSRPKRMESLVGQLLPLSNRALSQLTPPFQEAISVANRENL